MEVLRSVVGRAEDDALEAFLGGEGRDVFVIHRSTVLATIRALRALMVGALRAPPAGQTGLDI